MLDISCLDQLQLIQSNSELFWDDEFGEKKKREIQLVQVTLYTEGNYKMRNGKYISGKNQ